MSENDLAEEGGGEMKFNESIGEAESRRAQFLATDEANKAIS